MVLARRHPIPESREALRLECKHTVPELRLQVAKLPKDTQDPCRRRGDAQQQGPPRQEAERPSSQPLHLGHCNPGIRQRAETPQVLLVLVERNQYFPAVSARLPRPRSCIYQRSTCRRCRAIAATASPVSPITPPARERVRCAGPAPQHASNKAAHIGRAHKSVAVKVPGSISRFRVRLDKGCFAPQCQRLRKQRDVIHG